MSIKILSDWDLTDHRLLKAANIELGDKKHARGINPYTNPSVGDTWDEIDTFDQLIGEWKWNGSYWLSRQVYIGQSATFNNINSTQFTAFTGSFSNYNLYLLEMNWALLINGNNNDANRNWQLIARRSGATGTVVIASDTSVGSASSTWLHKRKAINAHVNTLLNPVAYLDLQFLRTGGSSNLSGNACLYYCLARR